MNAYHALADSYDRLTNDVDYEATVAFYYEILAREGLKPRTCVDLACGTGSVTAILAKRGLEVTGVDMSEEMLITLEPCIVIHIWQDRKCSADGESVTAAHKQRPLVSYSQAAEPAVERIA